MEETNEIISQRIPLRMKCDEFSQLRSVLPSITERGYTSPIEVIEEAIQYIAHLQATLEDNDSSMTTAEVRQQFRESASQIKSRIKFKERRIASFHAILNSTPKPRTLRGRDKRTMKKQQGQTRPETTTYS